MIDVYISESRYSDEIVVYVLERDSHGLPVYYLTADGNGRKKYKEGENGFPFISLSRPMFSAVAPLLMDAVIEHGIKPKKHTISDREWSAQRSHLEDMRKIAGKAVGVDL